MKPELLDIESNALVNGAADFGAAIHALKAGYRVSRSGWNGKGMWLALKVPDDHSKMGHRYVYMSDVAGRLFPWNPNNLDMLSDDWGICGQE